jgi:hypothetical protein
MKISLTLMLLSVGFKPWPPLCRRREKQKEVNTGSDRRQTQNLLRG